MSGLPWAYKRDGVLIERWMVYRQDGEAGIRLSDVVGSVFEEKDAEFIVRAVNNHEELLGAAAQMVGAFVEGVWFGEREQALDALMDAINKASR